MKYIVELKTGLWVAPWYGDPGMAVKVKNAKRFDNREDAAKIQADMREDKGFKNARIRTVDEKQFTD